MLPTEHGFCDYDYFVSDSPDRGEYNWTEIEVGKKDEQDCDYGTVGDTGKARRCCVGANQWENMYEGSECITFATLRLRQIAQVSMTDCGSHTKKN